MSFFSFNYFEGLHLFEINKGKEKKNFQILSEYFYFSDIELIIKW